MKYTTPSDVIAAFAGEETVTREVRGEEVLAVELKVKPGTVGKWPKRGVPRRHLLRILQLAEERGVALSAEQLLSTTSANEG